MNYWNECISEALSKAGIDATFTQIEIMSKIIESAHLSHDDYTGATSGNSDFIELQKLKKEYDDLVEKHRTLDNITRCFVCDGDGKRNDGFKTIDCHHCNSTGFSL